MLGVVVGGTLAFEPAANTVADRPLGRIFPIVGGQGLDVILCLVGKLVAALTEKFNTVKLVCIVRGRNHDTGVALVFARQVGNGRRRHNPGNQGVGTCRTNAGDQGGFEHVAGNTGVLANEDHRFMLARACQNPGSRPAQPKSQIRCQFLVGYAADTVRTE